MAKDLTGKAFGRLFGETEYFERIVGNIRSGLTNAKRGMMGKPKAQVCTYKGWRGVPPGVKLQQP